MSLTLNSSSDSSSGTFYLTQIVPSEIFTLANENGIWRIISSPVTFTAGLVFSLSSPGLVSIEAGTVYGVDENTSQTLRPVILSGTPASFSNPWQYDPQGPLNGTWANSSAVDSGYHTIVLTVFSSAETDNQFTVSHHYLAQ